MKTQQTHTSLATVQPVELPAAVADACADPEYRALEALAEIVSHQAKPRTPLDALQHVVDLARDMTAAKYAALAITDEQNRTEGFVTSGLTRAQLRALKVPPQGHGPLGSLRTDGKPVYYSDLDSAANAFGFPPKHPTMKTMLGVPIWAHGEVRGSLYVTDRNGSEPFRLDDEQILLVLARHATNIMERDWY